MIRTNRPIPSLNRGTIGRLGDWIAIALIALACRLISAKPVTPGHSVHGEAFNEGPRQAAVLMAGTGEVRFPITTKDETAQKFFAQGVGQLHGFWYFEAERSFRQAAMLDPDCAMAFWGMAMANINNQKRAEDFIKKADALKSKASRREQLWIGAWASYYAETKLDEKPRREALVKALEELSYEFPDDLEAKAFLVFQIWDNKNHGIPIPSRQAVDALAQQVLTAAPMHPGAHHYLIHLWNYSAGDKRATPSAWRCGQSAPGIAHMWHMPGHTFTQLKRYADAAWQQEASARVDHAQAIAARIVPDQIHNFAHNNGWLVKSLCHIGRVHDAIDLAKNMIELPRLGSRNGKSYELGRDELLRVLKQFEMWDELAALDGGMHLAPFDRQPVQETRRLRALGLAWLGKGDHKRAQQHLDALTALLEKTRGDRLAAAEAAEAKSMQEKKAEPEIERAIGAALRGFKYQVEAIQSAIAELRLVRALADGDREAAKKQLEIAKDIPSERLARIRFELGETDTALKLAREASDADDKQTQPLANLASLLWRAGKKDDAIAAFKKLRALSAQLDLDVPTFARLAPVAEELKLPVDWREKAAGTADNAARPDLESLGPFRWHPSPAPTWTLPDREEKPIALADFRGRAVLVVFYLGSGCAHCIEQLNVFAPLTSDFDKAGVAIVAVSTEPTDGLGKTFEKVKNGATFPFPIVSDPGLETFKAYRAFDDFERTPLHGTFLIDGAGLVRWQDINYEPFRDAKWLLGEAKRLLSVPAASTATAGR